ncbi:MAG: hypothetical protein AUH72_05780 [Acidobacteria bacterium 13_1_40CM_4_65_8]|nr:MAG: hypothetical protein AUH72_05780 [Acidobacteria bacterium 13_1_40CM_4_65_8]
MDFFAIEAHASDAKLHVISLIPTARCELVRVARTPSVGIAAALSLDAYLRSIGSASLSTVRASI